MKKKNLKKLIPALAAVIALSLSAFAGISPEATTQLEGALTAIGVSILTICSAFGVWANNDKE